MLCLQPSDPSARIRPRVIPDDARDAGDGRRLLCAACGAPITSDGERIEVDGQHEHRKMNPHGFYFEIGCFARAPGASPFGAPSHEFPWFSGFAWQVVVCASCGQHLGWRFSGEAGAFFGLILIRLQEEH